jgi:hypothetical protein
MRLVGEVTYHSRVTGNEERLPVAVSIIGPPGKSSLTFHETFDSDSAVRSRSAAARSRSEVPARKWPSRLYFG